MRLLGSGSILLEDGYEHFTMRKLADRCGYTAPTIYNHFGDKTGLIDAVLEEVRRVVLGFDVNRGRGESLIAFFEAPIPEGVSKGFLDETLWPEFTALRR